MEVVVPNTVKELLPSIDNEKKRLASGCTDIIVALKVKKLMPKPIIDLNNIEEIKRIFEDGNRIYIGANVSMSSLLQNPIINEKFELLSRAVKSIGSPQIRNRATLGGNIANASPSGDSILALTLLKAKLVLRNLQGERIVKIEDFIKGVGKTNLRNDEFIEYIVLEKKFQDYKSYFEKVGLRNAVVISVCSLGLLYKLDGEIIEDIKIAYGAVAPMIVEIFEAERLLKGCRITRELLEQAGRVIESVVSPIDDIRASAEYRRIVSKNLIMRLMENI